ncbi:MAG TPA: hypothetical protein VFU78_03945, partial [Thermomicrobiales bacterium]|nr:hypothetical protein [Thermomicrobiales bacterium]
MATERRLTPTTTTTPLPAAIARFLAAARRWLRLRAALTGAGYGLAAGLALGIAIGLVARLRPWLLSNQTTLAALGAVLVATLLGALVNTLRPLSTRTVAARYDHDLGLRERLSTALELTSGVAHSALAGQHLAETARLIARYSPRAAPLPRPSRDTLLKLGALAVALAALLLVPNDQTAAIQRHQAQQQLVQQAAQQVGQAQARVAARTDLDPATQAALQQQLAQLQRDLADGKLDPTQAVARIAQTEAGLRRLQDPNAANQAAGLPQLADEFGTFSATAPIGQKLQAGDYAGAAQALKDFASQLQGLDPASRAAIAQKLREAAASQAATNPQLAQQFQHAADLLDSGDIAGAQAALDAAADQLQQTGQAAAAQTVLSGTLGDLGAIKRDVANGQPPTTANATPQLPGGTPIALSGTPAMLNGTPFTLNGSPVALNGTPAVLGQGTPVRPTGGTPPVNATPVIVQGTGQGQGQG